jgi:hypothetical protein
MTPTDPETGLIKAAHPDEFKIAWKSATDGAVFGVDTATGATDKTSCGTASIHPGFELAVNQGNTCGLLVSYIAAPYTSGLKDKVVDLFHGGVSLTPVDPATGLINAPHPTNFTLAWTGATTAKVSNDDGTSCGDLTVDPVKGNIIVTGCDDLAGIYVH